MNNNIKLLQQAICFAARTKHAKKKSYHACIALRKDGVYVVSANSGPIEEPFPAAHAEFRCLVKATIQSTLWVARVARDKKTWAYSKPCKTCTEMIKNKKVNKVYYTVGPNQYRVWYPQTDIEYDVKKV